MTISKKAPLWAACFFILMFGRTTEAASLTVAWDPPADSTTTIGYVLWYGTATGRYTQRIDVGDRTTYTVDMLAAGTTYFFAVQAYNAVGELSPLSVEVSSAPSSSGGSGGGTPPESPTTPGLPSMPGTLFASLRDGRIIDLRWTSSLVNNPSGYRIELGSAPGRTDLSSFTTGVTATFSLSDLPEGTYYVRVRGVNDLGVGQASNEAAVTLLGAPGGPDAPRSLRSVVNGRAIQLTWAPPANAAGVSGYLIEAGSASGLANLAALPINAASFISPPIPNGLYYVRVRAIRSGRLSSASNEVLVSVGAASADSCATAPGVPAQLTASANGTLVHVSWQQGIGERPNGYVMEVGSAAGRRDIALFNFGASTTSFSSPAPNGTYVLRVTALNACGNSTASGEVSVTVGGPAPVVPGVPGSVVHDVSGATVSIHWTPPTSGGETTRYIVEASDPTGAPLATLDTGNAATSFTHGSTGAGVYVVRVRAANAAGVGPATDPVTIVVRP